MNQTPLRIGIIGGGIAGLASAHYLLGAGHTPVILEASEQLGGLGTHFEHAGVSLDKFYHVLLDSDADLCGLLGELGIADRLVWRETGMGFRLGGKLYGFNSPLDLLRFRALSFPDRIRTGIGAAYITKLKKQGLPLDDVYATEWLRGIFGPRIYAQIWEPLLRAKFGDRIYIRPGVGIAVHTGSARNFEDPTNEKVDFGSRVLFEPELGIGARINDRLSVEASWVHLSHAQLFGRQNPGMDNLGVRLNLAF